jgi:hypothetical protein
VSLTLVVGVRWFWSDREGRLDIDVDIDGTPVTHGERFPTPAARKKPDSFRLQLTPGRHRLRARSASQGAEIEFELSGTPRYAELCYDHYPRIIRTISGIGRSIRRTRPATGKGSPSRSRTGTSAGDDAQMAC